MTLHYARKPFRRTRRRVLLAMILACCSTPAFSDTYSNPFVEKEQTSPQSSQSRQSVIVEKRDDRVASPITPRVGPNLGAFTSRSSTARPRPTRLPSFPTASRSAAKLETPIAMTGLLESNTRKPDQPTVVSQPSPAPQPLPAKLASAPISKVQKSEGD